MKKFNLGANANIPQILSDIIFGYGAFVIAYISVPLYQQRIELPYLYLNILYAVFILIYVLSNKTSYAYNTTTFFYTDRYVKYVSKSFVTAAGAILLFVYVLGNDRLQGPFSAVFLVLSYGFLLASMLLGRKLLPSVAKQAGLRTLFIGHKQQYEQFHYYREKTNIPLTAAGYVIVPDSCVRSVDAAVSWFENIVHAKTVDQIYFFEDDFDKDELKRYVDLCIDIGVTVRIIGPILNTEKAYSFVSRVGLYPVTTYHTVSLNAYDAFVKRAVDIVGSVFGLLVLSPLMLLTALAVKLDSKGPVFFRQKRVGQHGRVFDMLKFRSMRADAEQMKKELRQYNEMGSELMFKIKDDPRITRVGKFIRKTSIDELPQLLNVLTGQMSLVGTRPPTTDEVARYDRRHWKRISIKPGITGMWQVSGRSNIVDFDEIVRLDRRYIDEWSVATDFSILLKTVFMLFTNRKNAY